MDTNLNQPSLISQYNQQPRPSSRQGLARTSHQFLSATTTTHSWPPQRAVLDTLPPPMSTQSLHYHSYSTKLANPTDYTRDAAKAILTSFQSMPIFSSTQDHSPTYCTEIKASAHNDANNDRNVPVNIKQHPMLTTPQQQISPTPPPHLPPPLAR